MTEEYLDDRHRELLDYFRNNGTDPEDRGQTITEEHTAIASQTEFLLNHVLVKNVSETITLDAVTLKKGKDFEVSYGEGKNRTKITLSSAAVGGETLAVEYHFGPSMIEREWSRTDVLLPRVIMQFITGSEVLAGIGDAMLNTKGSYWVASFTFEIRDKYASRAARKLSEFFNLARKLRHQNLFRMIGSEATNIQNFDYDPEKEAYVWMFDLECEWDLPFE